MKSSTQATSRGVIAASSVPKKKLQKHAGQAAVLQDVNNIFNTPATTVVSRGRSPSHRSSSPSQSGPRKKRSRSLSQSSPPPKDSADDRSSKSSHTKHSSKRAQSSSRSSPSPEESGTEHPSKRARASSPVASPKELSKCEWRDGKVPTGRPGARDYEREVSNIILESMREYAALMVSNNPVPLPEQQVAWATGSWERTCERNGVEYELPDRIIGLVSHVSINSFAAVGLTCYYVYLDPGQDKQCSCTSQGLQPLEGGASISLLQDKQP